MNKQKNGALRRGSNCTGRTTGNSQFGARRKVVIEGAFRELEKYLRKEDVAEIVTI